MAHSILGSALELGGTFGRPSTPEHRKFGARWFPLVEKLIQDGGIINHPLEVREGGLAKVSDMVEDLRAGSVRAKKFVVPLAVASLQ